MKHLYIILTIIVVIITSFIFIGITQGAGAQCKRAGYTGADLELCIKRASTGGQVYAENINKQ